MKNLVIISSDETQSPNQSSMLNAFEHVKAVFTALACLKHCLCALHHSFHIRLCYLPLYWAGCILGIGCRHCPLSPKDPSRKLSHFNIVCTRDRDLLYPSSPSPIELDSTLGSMGHVVANRKRVHPVANRILVNGRPTE